MMKSGDVLPAGFYERPTLDVTRNLLGKFLVRRREDGSEIAVAIAEVEAYDGIRDRACHASRGLTPRTEVLFGPPGHFYVYLCYGIHWLLNLVAGPEGYPAAVLVRGAGRLSGPGRLTKSLGIDGSHNRRAATGRDRLWVEDRGVRPEPREIIRTARIGVEYAGPVWAGKPYRFVWRPRAGIPWDESAAGERAAAGRTRAD